MARMNVPNRVPAPRTAEGAPAARINPEAQLRRLIGACMLWEDSFYADGKSVAQHVRELVPQVDPQVVAALAIETREVAKLRHAPLLLVRELARHPLVKVHGQIAARPSGRLALGAADQTQYKLVSKTLARVIQRADELAEFLALYWADGKQPLSKQVKRGLAWAFRKFSAYDLAKYNRDGAVKLRDVLFLVHPKAKDAAQQLMWDKLVEGKLQTPDTWEVALSAGADKRETFTRLLSEGKLGALALLRNLRNMQEARVDEELVRNAILTMDVTRVLPFRFVAAARHAPRFERELDAAMQKAMQTLGDDTRLPGHTVLLVDTSGSMQSPVSSKSDMSRCDAAAALAVLASGVCERVTVFKFNTTATEIPPRRGLALRDAIGAPRGGTYIGAAVAHALKAVPWLDRLIVFTDEQSADTVAINSRDVPRAYMVNVANERNGVGYGKPWVHVDGFSEHTLRFIAQVEREGLNDL